MGAFVVLVVEDEFGICLLSPTLWRLVDLFRKRAHGDRDLEAPPTCLVLDISLPDLNGLELQNLIASERTDLPIIFITGHGDVPRYCGALILNR